MEGTMLPTPPPSSWQGNYDLTPAAHEVVEAAERLAPGVFGARHVAQVLFCQHPLGPRLAGATCSTDVPILKRDVRRCVALTADDASATGICDDAGLLIRLAQAQRKGSSGPVDIGDLLLALFAPALHLEPVLSHSGLTLADAKTQLPKALRAVRLYESQAASRAATAPGQEDSISGAFLPELSKAMRVVRTREPTNDDEGTERASDNKHVVQARGSRGSEEGAARAPDSSNPWSTEESLAELAEMAPKSSKRAQTLRPALSSCGVDLVERAREGKLDPVIGRDQEIERVLQILARRTKNNVCLVGAPGVGKTAVAEAVAQRIAAGKVPPQLGKCRELWALDFGALLAGTGLRGDFEERLRSVLSEVLKASGEVLLFIDELHLALGAGCSENNNVDAANLMKPLLARGELRCIGATTSDEYRNLILHKDAAFERRFQVLELHQPSPAVAAEMLCGLLPLYASHHGLEIPKDVAALAVDMSHRFIHGRSLPDKAIDLLDEACSLAAEARAKVLTREHIAAVVKRCQNSSSSGRTSWLTGLWRPWSRL